MSTLLALNDGNSPLKPGVVMITVWVSSTQSTARPRLSDMVRTGTRVLPSISTGGEFPYALCSSPQKYRVVADLHNYCGVVFNCGDFLGVSVPFNGSSQFLKNFPAWEPYCSVVNGPGSYVKLKQFAVEIN